MQHMDTKWDVRRNQKMWVHTITVTIAVVAIVPSDIHFDFYRARGGPDPYNYIIGDVRHTVVSIRFISP